MLIVEGLLISRAIRFILPLPLILVYNKYVDAVRHPANSEGCLYRNRWEEARKDSCGRSCLDE